MKGRGRMFGDKAVLVIHLPGAIEKLSDFYASLGIRSAERSGGNIQEQSSQADGIIQSHFGGVVETDDPVEIEVFRGRTPSFFGLTGRDRKAVVKVSEEGG